ncbi:MAG: molybdopterin molybdotransferase MoeA [Azoarcus sp.]|jgi:molybdopterin molybdotransferase|nr:molybdopterin molybdotransferase MoeA [Azoarcus sp.]
MPEQTKTEHLSGGLDVAEAQACILEKLAPLGVEQVVLERALGRVLAADVLANRDLPPCDVSAMDGYAVRAADVTAAPVALKMVDDIKAGDTPKTAVAAGQCARIMTGAPVPQGADSVVRVEDTRALPDGSIEFAVVAKPGNDIRLRGENMRVGDVALSVGTEITPAVVGALAAVKAATATVYRLPSVAILANGDELEALDEPFDPARIPDSNTWALLAQTQAQGIEPTRLGIARDKPEELARHLERGLQYDVLLVAGGTSVGVHDHVRPVLEKLGVVMHFWRVEMRPGHPIAFGTTERGIVFCLPGNPVSAMVCFEQFVLPALRALTGHRTLFRRTLAARLTQPVKSRPGRVEFVRVTLTQEADGSYAATPVGAQGSADVLAMARAEGLLIAPREGKGLPAGAIAPVQLLDGATFQRAAEIER